MEHGAWGKAFMDSKLYALSPMPMRFGLRRGREG